jgi:hypothetical protein
MMYQRWFAILAACTMSGTAISADAPGTNHVGWDRAAMEKRHADMEARRADDMAVLIGLRADQRPAFDHFLQSMKPTWGRPDDRDAERAPRAPVVDASFSARLDAMQASADRRNAAAKQRIDAARQFYASLTPDQQHRFDALERLRHQHGHSRHFGMGGFRDRNTPTAG